MHVIFHPRPSLADGTAMLTPMLDARVHINGVLVPNTVASSLREGGDRQAAPELGQAALTPDCRIVFGRRHLFRLDVNPDHPMLASGSATEIPPGVIS